MINAIVWVAVSLMWGFVAYRVAQRVLRDKEARKTVEREREFVSAVGRESQAGARPEDAVVAAAQFVDDDGLALGARQLVAKYRLRIGGDEVNSGGVGSLEATVREAGEKGAGGSVGSGVDWRRAGGDRGSATTACQLGYFCQLWEIATERGIPLSVLAEAYATDLDAALERQEKYESAMAGARLTVTVLLALPVGAVLLGQTMGLDTPRFFVQNPLGALLLLLGSMLGCAGVQWTEVLTRSQWKLVGGGSRAGPRKQVGLSSLDIARGLDIFTAALQVGLPTNRAWKVMAQHWGSSRLEDAERDILTVGYLMDMGALNQAWGTLRDHSGFGPVARQALQQARSGTALTVGASAQAHRLRQQANNEATAAAEKMLVVLAAPLTLCFLPMFVVVGLLPLAIGLAGI